MRVLILLALVATTLWNCSNEPTCKYKPEPIFDKSLPHVEQYNFEKEGSQSLESLFLDTKVLLEIYQNVCPTSTQEYKFTVQGDFSQMADSLWMKEAVRQFVYLSSFSTKQRALKDWADVIELRRSEMKIGEDREIQPGIFVKVDRIVSPEKGVLLVTLSQK